MNFRRGRVRDEPEINFIPLIDLLLVILIFLMVTTTYSRYAELKINLPQADADRIQEKPRELSVMIDAGGRYSLNKKEYVFKDPLQFSETLKNLTEGRQDTVVIIHADAQATHQSVIHLMEAARLAGLSRLTFATQSQARPAP